jgi:hypothetical protein
VAVRIVRTSKVGVKVGMVGSGVIVGGAGVSVSVRVALGASVSTALNVQVAVCVGAGDSARVGEVVNAGEQAENKTTMTMSKMKGFMDFSGRVIPQIILLLA